MVDGKLTNTPVLSFPQPTPSSILPPVHTFSRRDGDKRPANSRHNAAKPIIVTISSRDDFAEVTVFETQRATVLSKTTLTAVPDDPKPNAENSPAADPTPQAPATPPPVVTSSMLPFILGLIILSRLPSEKLRASFVITLLLYILTSF